MSTKFNLEPIADRIVIRQDKAKEQTEGGLLLPERARERPLLGSVVAQGRGRILENGQRTVFDTKIGDRVLFAAYAGTKITYNDEELLTMREEDLIAIDRTPLVEIA